MKNNITFKGLKSFKDNYRTEAWADDIESKDRTPVAMVIVVSKTKAPCADVDGIGGNHNILETEQDCAAAASKAMLSLLSNVDNLPDEANIQMKEWVNGRIRKIVKHAKPGKFDTLDKVDWPHARLKVNDTECIVYSPLRENMMDDDFFKPVHKLQVSGFQAPYSNQSYDYNVDRKHVLEVTLNSQLHMTTGKMLAQLLHAVQVAVYNLTDKKLKEWVHDDCNVSIDYGTPDPEDVISIIDAGLTEIPAGSLTASADLITR